MVMDRLVLLLEGAETSLFLEADSLCKDRERGLGSECYRGLLGKGSTCRGQAGHWLCLASS